MKAKRSDSILWLVITILAAVICTAVRRGQLYSAFEGDLRLPIPMALPTILLVVLYVLCGAGLFLLSRRQPVARSLRRTPALALYAGNDTLVLGALVCSAFLSLIAAFILFRDGLRLWTDYQSILATARAQGITIPGGNNGVLTLATAVTSLLSFVGLLVVGKAAYRNLDKGRLAILLPAVNGCLWLMDIYRSQAANPVLWDYAPLLLAIVSGILMFLDWAGLYAGAFAPRRTLWMAAMTTIFSGPALAGEWTLSSAVLLCAQIIAALTVLRCVPNNLRYPPEPADEPVQAEEKLEEETHE